MNETLVLHICCAPDEAWGIVSLRERYNLRCFFSNPNISPPAEYELRLDDAFRVAKHFGIPFDADDYCPELWHQVVYPFKNTPEGGQRCRECFLLRLRRTAKFCSDSGITLFSTVMSVSPHKRIQTLNETGALAGQENKIEYLRLDLKKNDGFKKSILLSKELSLYRQDYCGCYLSKKERELHKCNSRRSISD